MKFVAGRQYTNRDGQFTVLTIHGDRMKVRLADGSVRELTVSLQERIIENMLLEEAASATCLCNWSDEEILADIVNETLPSEALVKTCCWKRVCQVRGRNFSQVDAEAWISICQRRGYLQERQNPRGF